MNIKTVGAVILAGAVIAGCGKSEEKNDKVDAGKVVLTVNGEKLTLGAIDADVEALLKAQGDKIPAEQKEYVKKMAKGQIAQSFIVEKVLVAKAKAAGYVVTDADRKDREKKFLETMAKSPDAPKSLDDYFKKFPLGEARARQEFENGIMIDKMIKDEIAKQPKTDYKAKAQEIIKNIVSNNTVAAASAPKALAEIKAIKAELDKCTPATITNKFAELAKAKSACPSGQRGGDLGEFTHGQMVKEFDEVAFKQPVNKVSDPVKTQFGYHLILTTKKTPAVEAKGDKPAEPEKVQASHILIKTSEPQSVPKEDEVVGYLQKGDERRATQEFVMNAVKSAKIEAFDDDFKQFVPPSDEPEAKCDDANCKDGKCAEKAAKKQAVEKTEKK